MRFSTPAVFIALMCMVHGAPQTGNPVVDGIEGSVTNARQVIDTLTRQLQSADGHPTADVISAAITGLDSQADNIAGSVVEAIGMFSPAVASVVGNALLGPFAQSITNGAEVLLSNLIGAPIDLVAGPAMKSLTESLSHFSALAKKNNVDTSKLDAVTSQLQSNSQKASNNKRDTGNPIIDGLTGSVTNARQVIDTLTRQLQGGDGHPAADVISAAITGLDSQADNIAGAFVEAVGLVSPPVASFIGNALLGPFAQSVTNGAEVLISNLIGAPIDLVAGPAMKALTQSLSSLSAIAKKTNVDTSSLDAANSKLTDAYNKASKSPNHKRDTGNPIIDGLTGSVTNARQVIDTLTRQLQGGDGHPAADVISAAITGLDSQADNIAGAFVEAVGLVSPPVASFIGNALLGPFAQSVTNGAEVLISNLIGAPIDLVAGPAMKALTQSLSSLSAIAKKTNVDTSSLDAANSKLTDAYNKASKSNNKRDTGNPIIDGLTGSVTNSRQVIDTLTRQLQSGDGHPAADVISAAITGLDSQADNIAGAFVEAVGLVSPPVASFIGNALLGPFAQSVTNGAEVLISNLIGAPIDLVAGPAMKALTQSLSSLSAIAKKTNVDTSNLDAVNAKLIALNSKKN